jgi:hypothetical protein
MVQFDSHLSLTLNLADKINSYWGLAYSSKVVVKTEILMNEDDVICRPRLIFSQRYRVLSG